MRGRILALAAALIAMAALMAAPSLADDAGYNIVRYSFQGALTERNVMEVTEVIDVDFLESSHGIFRDIPVVYSVEPAVTGGDRITCAARVEDFQVAEAPFVRKEEEAYLSVRIGSADELVEGRKTYTLSYRYVMMDDRIPDADLLYYSVLGTRWSAHIDRFDFEIALEKPLDVASLAGLSLSSGREGEGGNALGAWIDAEPSRIRGGAEDIPAGQGITLFCRLPQGYFDGAASGADFRALLSAGASGGLGLYALLRALLRRRVEVKAGLPGEPPADMDSAYAGRLACGTGDEKQILSLPLYWAERGHLSMKAGGDGAMTLRALKPLPPDAPDYQKKLWSTFFTPDKPEARLTGTTSRFAAGVEAAQTLLNQRLRPRNGKKALLLLAALCLATGALFYYGTMNRYTSTQFATVALIGVPLLLLGLFAQKYVWADSRGRRWGWGVATAAQMIVCAVIAAVELNGDRGASFVPWWTLVGAFGLTALAALLNPRLLRLPEDVARDRAEARLLRDYLKRTPEAELAQRARSDPGYACRLLPYAMAMGLAEDWAAYFRDVAMPEIDWFDDEESRMRGLVVGLIINRIDDQFFEPYRRSSQVLTRERKEEERRRQREARRSSGSSSGGFSSSSGSSGGGGGGGGGGRW